MKKILFVIALTLQSLASPQIAQADETCSCRGDIPQYLFDELLACYVDTRCNAVRNDVEISLRAKGRSLADAMTNYMQLTNNPLLGDAERQAYLARIETGRLRLTRLKELMKYEGYENLLEPLYLDFDASVKRYYRNYYAFNLGYEYVSLSEVFQKGFPRIGLVAYRRFGPTPYQTDGTGYYGVHVRGALQLTSSGEQSNSSTSSSESLVNTLEMSIETFVPFFRSLISFDNSLSDLFGVVVSYGAKKTDNEDHASSRLYTGFRSTMNPETYLDVMFGRSQGLQDTRMEVRGQLPMYKFQHGSRIFLGMITNMTIPGQTSPDRDVIRFYMDWNADFEKVIGSVKSVVGI